MTFETLNNNVMLVELSVDDMNKYNITYESLNNQDTQTQVAIRNLLKRIDHKKHIENGGKVVVEALPIDGGGCFFIFTFTQNRKRYRLKKHELMGFFSVEKLNDLLDLISTLRKGENFDFSVTLYQMNNCYYISVPRDNTKLNVILGEYGECVDRITGIRVMEYGRKIGKIYLQ